jgi:hypothetical protein
MILQQLPIMKHFTDSLRKHGGHAHRRRLLLARAGWIVLALLLLANFVASVPAYYKILRTVCISSVQVQCAFWQPTPGNLEALHRLHLSVETYAAYFVTLDVAVSLLFWVVGILIFWRKSNEWMGLFVSLVLIFFGSAGISDTLLGTFDTAHTLNLIPAFLLLINVLQWPALGAFLLTFPTGRFVPRWSWLIILLWIVQFGFFWLTNFGLFPLELLLLLVVPLTWGSTLGIQVYRYVQVYDAVQRQQTKWFVFACVVGLSLIAINAVLGEVVPGLSAANSWYQLFGGTITALFNAAIPLGVGIAILRYHLWDIDLIINRSLVYGMLTVILAALYVGLIIGLQALLRGIISQDNSVAIVISTLAIAALFQPLRQRLQKLIDRRFYRSKYDAARTVAAFSATLRQEVDLDQLREHLLAVVQETMQPAHVSLWLRQPEQPRQPRDHASSS